MLILIISALLVGQQATTEPGQTEIVVIGQRLSHWTGTYAIRGKKLRCATKVSSGDRDIDELGCRAFDFCADQLAAQVAATDEKSLSKDTRVAMKEAVKRDLSACVADKRTELVGDLARQRHDLRGTKPSISR